MDTYKALGKRIKEKRTELGMTQAKLSELCDRSATMIGIVERNDKHTSIETLVRIANALNVSADYLLGDSVNYKNTDYIAKTNEMLSDMDENEIEYAYDMLNTFRDFRGKKPIG